MTPASTLPQEISFFFLEPYRSAACASYSSCLGCLADQGCGWCLASATCHLRQGGAHCGAGGALLVLVPALCPLCEEHRDCHACTQVPPGLQRALSRQGQPGKADWERGGLELTWGVLGLLALIFRKEPGGAWRRWGWGDGHCGSGCRPESPTQPFFTRSNSDVPE